MAKAISVTLFHFFVLVLELFIFYFFKGLDINLDKSQILETDRILC